jgi:predicted RNA-binding protein with PIN domain
MCGQARGLTESVPDKGRKAVVRGADVDGEEWEVPIPDPVTPPSATDSDADEHAPTAVGKPPAPRQTADPYGASEPDAGPDAKPDYAADPDGDPIGGPSAAGASPWEGEATRLASPLHEAVRQRVVALAAETAGLLPPTQLPPALRPFARFTPAKRAKLAATPLAAAVETDAVFRERIADRVREAFPEVIAAFLAGVLPAAADPRDVAALAYLVRPAGWPELVEEAERAARAAERAVADEHLGDEVARLKAENDALRDTAKQDVERLKAEIAAERREGDSLRRRNRQLEADMRRAQADARRADSESQTARAEAAATVSHAESELRRARTRLTDAESALEAVRRGSRENRSAEEVRLRLLLETISEAATGLRRELALSPTEQRPADTVEAVRPAAPGTGDVEGKARAHDDPAVLDQLLALPRAHLIIDGYNVTKTGYPTLSLHEQRVRLLRGLGSIAARTGAEVTCVFDGAELGGPVPVPQHKGVRVLFSRPGEIADELIRRLVAAEPQGRPLIVVSSDREVADGVRRSGARPVPSAMLVRALARG